jgi:hypothetical protein
LADSEETEVTTTTSLPAAEIEAAIRKVFRGADEALSPERLHEMVREAAGDEVTFAEVRRALWTLVRHGKLEITPDWKITRHSE